MAIQNRRGADADFDPNKVLPGEFGFTTDGSRKVYAAFAPNDVKEVAFKEDVPTKTSDLANDTGFVTKTVADLINYYTKSETYTQEEINQLVSTIPKFSIQPVPELPTEKISTTTVYLLTTGEESENLYTEYIYVNGAWEKLGTQKLDLSGYALNSDIPTKLSELINDTEFITAAVDNLVNYYTKKEMEERLYEKANSIISTRTGTVVATTDSAKAKPKNIKLFGKSEQDGTPSIEASIEIQSHGDSGSIVGKVLTGNLVDIDSPYGNYLLTGSNIVEDSNYKTYKVDVRKFDRIYLTIIAGSWFDTIRYALVNSNGVYTRYTFGTSSTKEYKNLEIDTLNSDTFYLCGSGQTIENLKMFYESIMVSVSPIDYEPYTEQPFTVLTPNGLPGIPLGTTIPDVIKNSPIHMSGVYWDNATSQYYIGDTVEFESGEYVQRIAEIDNSNWGKASIISNTTGYRFQIQKSGILKKSFIPIMCTHFQVKKEWTYGTEGTYIATDEAESGCISLRMEENSPFTTTDECIAWMNENDVKTNYVLAKPIITDLTQEELDQYNALLMNYPNTTVVNDAGAYMEVEYVADTKEHIKQNYVAKSEHEALKNRVSEIENVIANL